MSDFMQFVFSGLTTGSIYALAALGFALIYNASGVINFAQGDFLMLGGMVACEPCQSHQEQKNDQDQKRFADRSDNKPAIAERNVVALEGEQRNRAVSNP